MPNCNSYGWSGGFAALSAASAWFLYHDKGCSFNIAQLFIDSVDARHAQAFHYVAIIVGVLLFVLSFFDFAGILYEITLLFCAAALGIFVAGGLMIYATYMDYYLSCRGLSSLFSKNVIEAEDSIGITIMILDLIAACLLISAAISFSRTY